VRYEEHELVENRPATQFVVRPNRSLSREGMLVAFFSITAVLLTIAGAFTLMGAWLIFPFAGLEALVFGGVFLWFYRHYDDHEYIVVEGDAVTITRRFGGRESVHSFQRYWTRVTVEPDPHPLRPPHILLGSHGVRLEIAADLSGEERMDFAQHLKAALQQRGD
jgi:uncharacterized membrane protein